MKAEGVWVSEPVPMYPFPGSPLYVQMFGPPDDQAWERAHHYYTTAFAGKGYSDIQEPAGGAGGAGEDPPRDKVRTQVPRGCRYSLSKSLHRIERGERWHC